MPSTYAHYRFGQEVRNALPCREQKTVDSYPEGFILGVGAKMFTIAGPVIVYGTVASVVYGIVYYITTLF